MQLALPRSRFEESAGSRSSVTALTESIQDTSPRIHSFAESGPRNKKPVSDETCPPNLSVLTLGRKTQWLSVKF